MSLSKVVKSKQCYLHPKTNTDNMHISCLNFIFKQEHTKMGAISSEIVFLMKLNCPYKMTRDGFSCFLGFQNF